MNRFAVSMNWGGGALFVDHPEEVFYNKGHAIWESILRAPISRNPNSCCCTKS